MVNASGEVFHHRYSPQGSDANWLGLHKVQDNFARYISVSLNKNKSQPSLSSFPSKSQQSMSCLFVSLLLFTVTYNQCPPPDTAVLCGEVPSKLIQSQYLL